MRPHSHDYDFSPGSCARWLMSLAAGVLAVVGLLRLASVLHALPAPVPGDLDHTILAEKARLAVEAGDAAVVLAGDSSCMMDVDTLELGRRLGATTINLGTLSYLDLADHSEILSRFLHAHPVTPRTIVVLMHPEALRHGDADPGYSAYFRAQLEEDRSVSQNPTSKRWEDCLGIDTFRERIIQACIPTLLPGEYGVRYGSTREAARQLRLHRGSFVDPARFDPVSGRGSSEFRLAKRLEDLSREFRHRLPEKNRLLVGITPVPASTAGREHRLAISSMLGTWSAWLSADKALTNLPSVLPDDSFATRTHLNVRGVGIFTDQLGAEIAASLGNP